MLQTSTKRTIQWFLAWAIASLIFLALLATEAVAQDAAALQQRINKAPPGSTITLAPGNYYLENRVYLKSGVSLAGPANAKLIRHPSFTGPYGMIEGVKVTDLSIKGITIDGRSQLFTDHNPSDDSNLRDNWSEYRSSIILSAAKRVNVEGVTFLDPASDAVLIDRYRQHTATGTYYNECGEMLSFKSNKIYGRGNGRDGFTVTCGYKVTIAGNYIANVSTPRMPGGINIETDPGVPYKGTPCGVNKTRDYLWDIYVSNNTVVNHSVPPVKKAYTLGNCYGGSVQNISFVGNSSRGNFRVGLMLASHPSKTKNVLVKRNTLSDTSGGPAPGFTPSGIASLWGTPAKITENTIYKVYYGKGRCIYVPSGGASVTYNKTSYCIKP